MSIAFVLGNGISRKSVQLDLLKTLGKVYGCNALYREFVPDVLVATDRPIATEIQNSGYAKKHLFYTRRPIADSGANRVPQEYFGYSSGPLAVSIACKDHCRRIYMLGFDLGPTSENKFNNVYAGTEFYKPAGSLPTFTGNWVKQLCKIVNDNSTSRFFRVCGETTAKIPEFEALPNMKHLELADFLNRINNKKDL
jgi:hypothetical protein